MKLQTQQLLQQRKFMMILPLLVTPFITMIFWALGGGQATPVQAVTNQSGLNLNLPSAHFIDKPEFDKLTLYEQRQRDSAKFQDALENDPYFDLRTLSTSLAETQKDSQTNSAITYSIPKGTSIDLNEEKVNQKLEEIYAELNKTTRDETETKTNVQSINQLPENPDQFSSDVKKLENLMASMSSGTEDPEMIQIDNVLEKILDIQHPDRLKAKISNQSLQNSSAKFPVRTVNQSLGSWIGSPVNQQVTDNSIPISNVFFGLNNEEEAEAESNMFQAVIHDTQEVVSGSTVKLRLQSDLYINNTLIPRDNFIFGTASLSGERLTITIASIRSGNSLIPVSLSTFDLDGIEGIYIPGAIARDAAREASDQAVQDVQFLSLSPSIGAQAASAGMQAVKGFLGKKSKLIRVTLKAGYQILLRNSTNQ
ncbi:MAG: conjugative transposon protein TraM [Cyclobacteriaceae bacterium]